MALRTLTPIFVAFAIAFASGPVEAGSMIEPHTGDAGGLACGTMMRDAGSMLRAAEAGLPVEDGAKAFDDDKKRCPSDRYVNAGNGYANFARAIALHNSGGAWQPPLSLAVTQLQTCASAFDGDMGAHCRTAAGKAAAHQTDWPASVGGAAAPASSATP